MHTSKNVNKKIFVFLKLNFRFQTIDKLLKLNNKMSNLFRNKGNELGIRVTKWKFWCQNIANIFNI